MGYLDDGILLSEYNEGTEEQIDYYIRLRDFRDVESACMYSHAENSTTELEVVHIIRRSDDAEVYDSLLENENVLIEGESTYQADTSAEFVSGADCYMVWFKTLSTQKGWQVFPASKNTSVTKWRELRCKTENEMHRVFQSVEKSILIGDDLAYELEEAIDYLENWGIEPTKEQVEKVINKWINNLYSHMGKEAHEHALACGIVDETGMSWEEQDECCLKQIERYRRCLSYLK